MTSRKKKPLGKKAMKSAKGGTVSGRITGIAVDPSNPNAGIIDGTSNTILFGEKVIKP